MSAPSDIHVAATGQALLHAPLRTTGDDGERLRAFFAGAAAVTNFEGAVVAEGAWLTKTKTPHLASAEAMASLAALGFGALGHANNHAFDLGPPGIAATRSAANASGLGLAGSGATAEEARRPALVATAGGTVALLAIDLGPQPDLVYADERRAGIARLAVRRTVAVPSELLAELTRLDAALGDDRRRAARSAVGYQAAGDRTLDLFGQRIVAGEAIEDRREADAGDLAALEASIGAARGLGARIVVVCLHSHHWDPDWTATPPWQLALCRSLVDRGADMVIGHGAPVLQPVVFHRGRPILAGLGNFVFHTRRVETYRREGVDVFRSVAVKAAFGPDGACRRLDVLPIAVGLEGEGGESPCPSALPAPDADDIMAHFTAGLGAAEAMLVHRAG